LILSRVPDSPAKRDVGDYKREIFQALVVTTVDQESRVGRVLRLY
jgi:hypothetical protein